MKVINDKLALLANIPNHYLVRASGSSHPYFEGFMSTAESIQSILTEKEFEYWCTEKMLLKQKPFAEKKFIQYAVETTVAKYFGTKFPEGFRVEAKVNPENYKDVDCQFIDNGFVYNVEVKCSDFKSKEKIDSQDAFKFVTEGRLPDKGQKVINTITDALIESLTKKGEEIKPFLVSKNMDNNLKEFLELAHEKFNPNPSETEINILLVGCDDVYDIQNWVNYLYAHEGLFTKDSFADRRCYQNVDLVVFTNQYFKHNKVLEKNVAASWTLDDGFNIVMVNPNRLLKKTEGIRHFLDILPNYNTELGKYEVPGIAGPSVKDSVRISHFVKEYLEEKLGRYVFEAKP
ncbi:hypothetical protein [Sphingobacterium ginsenosidimutans]|uniref:Restriction endonuclease n=1 Tax=Sphingobacterium ginsenosidimutans TaxID=687845 RepID=A0ABP8AAF3_9SPHI